MAHIDLHANQYEDHQSGHAHARGDRARTGGRTSRDRARRSLSQNFLVDRRAVRLVVRTAAPDGLVLEPGPGEGVLTRALADAGARVIGYELDPRLAARLAASTRDDPRVRIVRGDFAAARPPGEPFAVVGNIPYSATSRIVGWCLRAPRLTSATLLTQREYARKRAGDYGRWTLVTVRSWPWFHWRLGSGVPRESFRPIPSVDSAILRLERRPAPLVGDRRGYLELVELGFGGVGGSLRASLRRHYRGVDAALRAAGVARDAPVGHVHPDQWVTLWERLRG
ncbi:ErmE/ErmH/ErmO/ErmR family 23S rRNA (adenine(2058)-N(6))-methyltransferase [Nonomuraea pusilla]|uniref:23S rRNA (Adenine-N6)-dimethyltransferase n=1 Tax=Nonomuraea pusilla TaxID=46177 RepID=A0A1H7VZ58_9ACTN|nr:ErmE/ErmH/ErmO/ErmR family 23S rRNA (adenine(2058)-N(6))-methyltransferase [Nonomuraea pusilla]SEM14149.1 23S rRNA (adenine-N6)-dimethyltransferase [Nonomuraea pusilla]